MNHKTDYSNKFYCKTINNITILHRNNAPVECIYKSPVMLPHPTISGQAVIKQTLCGELCPMFNYKKQGLFNSLTLECTKLTFTEIYHEDNLQ